MIEIREVTKKYGKFTAVDKLSMTVDKGSVYGLVGYNGAGKTTLLKTVAGIFRADGGSVTVDGVDVFDSADVKRRMFYVPDDLYFNYNSSIEKMAKFYAGYYPKFSFETLDKLCGVFKLDKTARINSFSKGMQRQAAMILGMSTLPEILLLDESFDGLDPAKRSLMNNMLIEYAADRECSIIVSSHNLHELTDICDHVASGVEDLPAVDGDFSDGFPGVGLQQAAFVGHAAAHGGVEDGFHEKHLVEHARHGAAVGFRLDAVVKTLVAGRGVGIRHPGAVGGETVGHMRTGACDAGERGGRRRSQGQYQYAEPDIHSVKITFFSGIKYGKSHPEALRMRKKVHPKVNLFLLRRPDGGVRQGVSEPYGDSAPGFSRPSPLSPAPPRVTGGLPWPRYIRWRGEPSSGAPWG